MAGYKPLKITGNTTGLVQGREEFILPDDAYPTLQNAFVWRERIKRKKGYQLLGRLKRAIEGNPLLGSTDGFGVFTGNLFTILGITGNPQIVTESIEIHVNSGTTFTDQTPADGTLTDGFTGTGTINYITGEFTITTDPIIASSNVHLNAFEYYPGLPVMGLRSRELASTNNEQMVAFDQKYAYRFGSSGFEEFLPGTTWTGNNSDFFWSTNYWVGDGNLKIFWVTNDVDPIRYTNGVVATNWVDFSPIINAALQTLDNCLCMLPFRGRMLAFNTTESGATYPNRIRWAAIGNPFTIPSPIVTTVVADAWRDDIRGKGGFLDIPTSEDIITVGFVRDNLVIYCERSTWQLRYTGRSIAPFQIEKVNTELGVESTFSGIQFDTSLVGIGDKGIVECDSYKSERIDIKIPDLVMNQINNQNNGTKRVHGIRDFQQRLAFWIYPNNESRGVFPDRRLCYNYENDSWAIFTDSLTCLGNYQAQTPRKWITSNFPWKVANFPWFDRPSLFPNIMGGNQQGFVLYLDKQTTNQESLFISDITGNTTTPTLITSPAHNLQTGHVIKIINIPAGTPFATSLNNKIFGVVRQGPNSFLIMKYSSLTGQFSDDQLDDPAVYIGDGLIQIRDNFSIVSKKFNYMDQGRQYQFGFIDVLFDYTTAGAITLNVYTDYEDNQSSNTAPENANNDTFFNSTVETNSSTGLVGGSKNMKRVFCPTNSNFITLEWTLSNSQMVGVEQESDVQIDAQIIWSRIGGRLGITN